MTMWWGWDPMWSFSKIWVQILYFIHWRYLICWSSIALDLPQKICWVRQNLGCDLKVGQCRPNAKLATLTNELWLTYVRAILKVIKWDLFLDDYPINMCFSWYFWPVQCGILALVPLITPTFTPSRHTSQHHSWSIKSHQFLTYKYGQPTMGGQL
jgi:hypothetical protein